MLEKTWLDEIRYRTRQLQMVMIGDDDDDDDDSTTTMMMVMMNSDELVMNFHLKCSFLETAAVGPFFYTCNF